MKIFVSYRATGEDQQMLLDNLRIISDSLHAIGHEPYCTHLQQTNTPDINKIKTAFTKIDESDAVFVFVHGNEVSEGMALEIGYAYNEKPIHVFALRGAHLVSFELADSITEWDNVTELEAKIADVFPKK